MKTNRRGFLAGALVGGTAAALTGCSAPPAVAAPTSSSNPKFVARGAIPWLLLRVVGDQPGPTGSDQLLETTHIQRLNTAGGMAPSAGCSRSADVGAKALVPYTADYYFFTAK